jgi:hypothetical protein
MRDFDLEYALDNTLVIQTPKLNKLIDTDVTFGYSVLFEDMDKINVTHIHEGLIEAKKFQQVTEEEFNVQMEKMGFDPFFLKNLLPNFMKAQMHVLKRHIRNETTLCSIDEAVEKVMSYPGSKNRLIVTTVENYVHVGLLIGIHETMKLCEFLD